MGGQRRGFAFVRAMLAALAALAIAGCTDAPQPSGALLGPLPAIALDGPDHGVPRAMLMESLVPRWGAGPDGPLLLDDFGENLSPLEAGRQVVVLGEPQEGPDGMWVRVWVIPDPQVALGDFFAWLPLTIAGRPTLRNLDAAPCPGEATIATLAPLLPADRLRCVGGLEITIDARSWLPGGYPPYDVKPSWFGSNSDLRRTVALFDPGPEPFGPGAPFSAERAGAWIDARVPPTGAVPPPGMYLRVTGHFGDAGADACERALNPERASLGPPGAGFPLEAKTDSVAWCREQFVVTDWEVILGPEGRPIDRAAPQLHRQLIPDLPPGVEVGCAGVGMPPLTVRIDPEQLDPVWIETPQGGRSVAVFGPEFQLVVGDAPRVVAANGVVLTNGEIVDPDRPKAGLVVCPGGDVISFDIGRPGVPG